MLDSRILAKTSMTKANVYWQECTRRHNRSILVVSARHLLRDVTIHYVVGGIGLLGPYELLFMYQVRHSCRVKKKKEGVASGFGAI